MAVHGDIRERRGFVEVSFDAPLKPSMGDLWFDKSTCSLKLYVAGAWRVVAVCEGVEPPVGDRLLQENGSLLLQEDGSSILL